MLKQKNIYKIGRRKIYRCPNCGQDDFYLHSEKNRMIAERIFQPFEINNNLEKRRRAMTLVSGLL